jgi:DNA-binding PadR family transcriptional regulator
MFVGHPTSVAHAGSHRIGEPPIARGRHAGCDDGGVTRATTDNLLLGEWACLGILYPQPTHGFAIAARLKPSGDVGRVWSLSRPLTYRGIEQLTARDYVRVVGEEPGLAGGNRTILAATRTGKAQLRTWLATPVAHLRDLRSELLLKLVIAEICGIDITATLEAQRRVIDEVAAALAEQIVASNSTDVVALWRNEAAQAALRFLDRLGWCAPWVSNPEPMD